MSGMCLQELSPISVHTHLHSHPLHYSKTSTGYPLNGEYTSNWPLLCWPPWRIRHYTLASHLTCLNYYDIMNQHGLCDLPVLVSSLFRDTTLNLARVHFESQHQKSGIYKIIAASIRKSPSLSTFRRHLKTYYFQSSYPNP